ncbi:DUF1566 domain-containing protein [Flavobacteriales bacterium]|nr:DUF1566 domain-containing protein [Flavobacteriales bacterium]
MKKFLLLIFVFPLFSLAQTINSIEHYPSINLESGWNMIGYTCLDPMNVEDALISLGDTVLIVKDNNGNVYLPEFNFNGIEQFEFGFGYQLKLSQAVFNFSFCPFLVPLVEGCTDEEALNYSPSANWDNGSCIDMVTGCIDATAFNFDSIANTDDNSCVPILEGCIDSSAFNYNDLANTDNESCIYLGCTDSLACNYNMTSNQDDGLCEYPLEEGLDCDGNPLINCFYPPDPLFVSWLQDNTEGIMFGNCLDINRAADCDSVFFILGTDIIDLNGIQYFTNLSSLVIDTNGDLSSLPELSGLTNLSFLNIRYTYALTNLPELSGLTNLSGLYIADNVGLTSLPELSGLTNLSVLSIADNLGLTSLPELSGLTNLTELIIESNDNLECVGGYPEQLLFQENWPTVCPSACPYEAFLEYSPNASSYDYAACIIPVVMGCMDSIAENYNIEANEEDGSCEYILGCMDNDADNFNQEATQEDNSCIYYGCIDSLANNYDLIANQDDGSCIYFGCIDESADNFDANANTDSGECIDLGCIDESAHNYDAEANTNDGSCIFIGCTNQIAENYNSQANQDDGSCIILGCTNFTAENYFTQANQEAESCIILGCTFDIFPNYNSEATQEDGSCDMNSEDVFGCTDSTAFNYNSSANTDNGSCIEVIEGCTNATAFNYNSSANTDDNSCVAVEEGCTDATAFNYNSSANTDIGSCIPFLYGCTDSLYLEFDASANTDDGSCATLIVEGCMDLLACNFNPEADMADGSCEYPEQGYDCEGNITAEIGDIIEGGYLFYLDETGQHGLVAALEDIGQFQWGCYGENVNGSDGTSIGTGLQNTLEIVSGCSETPIAASEALAYESGGYSDWYLPSKDELIEMYNTIGNGSPEGDIGGFGNDCYWSSSESNGSNAWGVDFFDGNTLYDSKHLTYRVRVIRAFGYTLGCIDSLACNYNPDANMADGSCEYAELGYDCEGDSLDLYIGQEAYGGIVFYVDETGEHGLVAAMEDLEGTYQWGCYGTELTGADGQAIGTGYQNTMDIVNQGCDTGNGGITAAQAALDAEINGYSDWYLPSKDELYEMYSTIGNEGLEGNIGGFDTSDFYWSSSEYNNNNAWTVDFDDGYTTIGSKNNTVRVRVIRAF